MAFANDDFIVVAFRGTESKSDWETNFDYAQVPLYTSYEVSVLINYFSYKNQHSLPVNFKFHPFFFFLKKV